MMDAQAINKQLSSLVDAYANGSMAAAEYRQQRRALICEYTGQPVPEVEAAGSGEQTQPAMAAVPDQPVPETEQVAPAVDVGKSAGKGLYVLITVVTVLVALAGAGGLFWFIFRE